jgi:MFS family permease
MSDSRASPPGATPADPAPREDRYAVLRNRNFLLYLTGRFIASLGQQMLTVAVGWELYERTHSSLALGLVGLTQMVPMVLLTLPAGHLADNRGRHGIILLMVLVSSVASLGLAGVSIFHLPVVGTYVCLFVAGTARTFLWPASAAFLPQLVPRRVFSRAVTWNSGAYHFSSVAGPAVGGAVIALTHSAATVYVLNTAATLVCLVLIGMVRCQAATGPREEMSLASLVAGFRFVYSTKIVFGIITLDLFAVLLGGATALLPVYAKDILGVGPTGLGLLQAALPAGSLVSALILAHRPPMNRAGRALLWSVAVFGLATIGFGLSQSFALSLAMLALCGAVDNVSVVVRHTLVQLLTPDETRGRVSAVNSLFIGTSNELGGFESGVVASWFGPIVSVVSGGIGTIIVVIAVALIWPEIRRYGRLDSPA